MSAPVTFQALHSTEILINLSLQKQVSSMSFSSHSVLKELCETLIATLIYNSVSFIKGPTFRALTSQVSPLLCRGLFLSVYLLYVCFSTPNKTSFADHMKKIKIKKKTSWSWTGKRVREWVSKQHFPVVSASVPTWHSCLDFPQWPGRNRWYKPSLHPS